MASVRLFVYGSLKRAALHHAELEQQAATFVGEATTPPGYALEPLGDYLALVSVPGGAGTVTGELFEIDEGALPALDAFEGDAYTRFDLCVKLDQSREFLVALAYFSRAR